MVLLIIDVPLGIWQIWNISWQIWRYSGKPENETLFQRSHYSSTMRKNGEILVKTLFWRTHYTFGNILFWTFGQILPATKLFCSLIAMLLVDSQNLKTIKISDYTLVIW